MGSCSRLVTLAVMLSLACHAAPDDPLTRARTSEELRAAASLVVWPGMAAESSSAVLEQHGFACRLETNASYGGRHHLDYVHCYRSTHSSFIITQRLQVALVIVNGRVSEILANTGLVGP